MWDVLCCLQRKIRTSKRKKSSVMYALARIYKKLSDLVFCRSQLPNALLPDASTYPECPRLSHLLTLQSSYITVLKSDFYFQFPWRRIRYTHYVIKRLGNHAKLWTQRDFWNEAFREREYSTWYYLYDCRSS